ncbi:PEP/pyruvate-binding domain-containing protein [Patescibacteria group bacterium]|nr:PEP/pyruvate-binding domain-containing protein [Patescibacteria group bacterium]MBU1931569.1 PEP/pyruvate-binding domain-containing protein [Patescibacteria group bacterium]
MILKQEKNFRVGPQIVGGKGWHLLNLFQKGFNIPRCFFVTTEAFDYFAEENSLIGLLNNLSLDKSSQIRKKILAGRMSPFLVRRIEEEFLNYKFKTVAVRSSINIEDGARFSFAGQFESFLSIELGGLYMAIKKCWAATFSQRALFYTLSNNLALQFLRPAAIIQKMVQASKSGVIFTQNPDSRRKEELLIEAVEGNADKLVDGFISPEKVIVSKLNLKPLQPPDLSAKKLLSSKEIQDLSEIALKIERLYGCPQDIEWAIAAKKIYILQARPLTGLKEVENSFLEYIEPRQDPFVFC